jgi:hypothetical protein
MISANDSDALAVKYFNENNFIKALKQNKITQALLYDVSPNIHKNNASCYSRLFRPLNALNEYKEYMRLSKSKTTEDIRQLSDYYLQAGLFDESLNIILNMQNESFEKYHDLSLHMFRLKNYSHGFRFLQKGKIIGNILWIGNTKWNMLPDCPRWVNEDITNKKICLVGECGLGDELIFSRWIPEILTKCKEVHYLTDNTLLDVFIENFPGLIPFNKNEKYDYWIPTMDLPILLNIIKIFPISYIKPNEKYIDKWKNKLKNIMPFYCINWTGSKNYSQNYFRDIPIDYLLTKLYNKNIINICMETDYNPPNVIDFRHEMKTWNDTLAILYLSEMLFTSCSSVAHGSGAIGNKTFVYTRPDDYFVWNATSNGTKCNWYDDVTVWRTDRIGKWKDIIDKSFYHINNK